VDEILIADPARFSSLTEFADSYRGGVTNAIGFDVHHVPSKEGDLDLSIPILQQRRWIRFSSSMCKPAITTQPIIWAPGFHSADAPIRFGGLYLFHLRYFDVNMGLSRLQRTRSMDWSSDKAGRHQRMEDNQFIALMKNVSTLPATLDINLSPEQQPLLGYLEKVISSEKPASAGGYNLNLHIFGETLFEIPSIFRKLL
jgi:hypothetical protein